MRGASLCLALGLLGCASGPAGTASFSAVSKKLVGPDEGEVVAYLDTKMCTHNALIVFAWGEQPNHEYLVRTALDEYDADVITNAQLDFTALPLVLYNENCARVRGDVVRLRPAAGEPAADAAPGADATPGADAAPGADAEADVEGSAQ